MYNILEFFRLPYVSKKEFKVHLWLVPYPKSRYIFPRKISKTAGSKIKEDCQFCMLTIFREQTPSSDIDGCSANSKTFMES